MRHLGRCGRSRRKKNDIDKVRMCSKSHDESFIELQKWMKKTTEPSDWCLCKQLQPCDFPETGRGMRALSNFKSGDCIVSIPHRLLMTMDTVFDSIGQDIKRHCDVLTPQQALTVLLAVESVKGRLSKWSVYINSLPKLYSTPLYFSTAEINLLRGKAKELAETLRDRFHTACLEMTHFVHQAYPSLRGVVTGSVLKWAWSTVDTRSVFLETKPHDFLNLKPEESNVALAPFLDMLNHNDSAQITAGLNPSSNCYEITTETEYKKYDQVFISYGPHDNTKLLINYGFTLPQNLNNCYMFSTDDIKTCFPTTEHWERKMTLMRDGDLNKSLVCTMDGPSWSLMTALKLVALSWQQLCLWKNLLQGMSLGDENDATATFMANTLVKEALWKAKRHVKYIKSNPPTTHMSLALSLSEDDVGILDNTLQMLAVER